MISEAELREMKERTVSGSSSPSWIQWDNRRLIREVEELRTENAIWKERTKFASDANEELRAALRDIVDASERGLDFDHVINIARAALGETK